MSGLQARLLRCFHALRCFLDVKIGRLPCAPWPKSLEKRGSSGVFAVLDGAETQSRAHEASEWLAAGHGGNTAAFGGATILEEALKQLSIGGKSASEVTRVVQEGLS